MKLSLALSGLLATILAAPAPDIAKRELQSLQSRDSLDLAERTTLAELQARAPAALNTSREYYLQTKLKPGQPKKTRFDNLWLYAYHTGAGLDDAMLSPNKSYAIKGFLNHTADIHGPRGQKFYSQEFDLGSEFPYSMVNAIVEQYTAWQPVQINAGVSQVSTYSGYFMNSTGLQWSSSPATKASNNLFFGWIVCEWWHPDIAPGTGPAPQLFYRYPDLLALPSSCADVDLVPEYI